MTVELHRMSTSELIVLIWRHYTVLALLVKAVYCQQGFYQLDQQQQQQFPNVHPVPPDYATSRRLGLYHRRVGGFVVASNQQDAGVNYDDSDAASTGGTSAFWIPASLDANAGRGQVATDFLSNTNYDGSSSVQRATSSFYPTDISFIPVTTPRSLIERFTLFPPQVDVSDKEVRYPSLNVSAPVVSNNNIKNASGQIQLLYGHPVDCSTGSISICNQQAWSDFGLALTGVFAKYQLCVKYMPLDSCISSVIAACGLMVDTVTKHMLLAFGRVVVSWCTNEDTLIELEKDTSCYSTAILEAVTFDRCLATDDISNSFAQAVYGAGKDQTQRNAIQPGVAGRGLTFPSLLSSLLGRFQGSTITCFHESITKACGKEAAQRALGAALDEIKLAKPKEHELPTRRPMANTTLPYANLEKSTRKLTTTTSLSNSAVATSQATASMANSTHTNSTASPQPLIEVAKSFDDYTDFEQVIDLTRSSAESCRHRSRSRVIPLCFLIWLMVSL